MNRRAWQIAALIAAFAAGPFALAQSPEPGPAWIDLTPAIGPVQDGRLAAVFVRDGVVVSFVRGDGQACEDGWLRVRSGSGEAVGPDLALGANGPLSDSGAYNESPELVAAMDADRFVLNLRCGAEFPRQPRAASDGITWNVVLYDRSAARLRNLTGLCGVDQQACRALGWFPEEGVLLVERRSAPREPTLRVDESRLECLHIDSGTWRRPEDVPRAAAFLRAQGQLLKQRNAVPGDPQEYRWQLGWKEGAGQPLAVGPTALAPSLVEVVRAEPPLAIVSHPQCGTWLLDPAGRVRLRITDEPAVSLDRQSGTVVVRSQHPDGNGQYLYRSLDLAAYLRERRTGEPAAEAPANGSAGAKESNP